MPSIDLNCDLGESFGAYTIGMDAEILPYVTSANIACGFHAGDPSVMQKSVLLCKKHGVQVGAHPRLPDLQGFGRRRMAISPAEAEADVMYQIGALKAFCDAAGVPLHHVKPHGALYNMAARDQVLAAVICRAVQAAAPGAVLLALSGSEMVKAAQAIGLPVANEVFADRGYRPDGSLVPRGTPGAMIEDEDEAIARIADSEIVLVNKLPITERLLDACPSIRLICVQATGYNTVDCAACARRGIPVTNVPTYGTAAVAQFTFALMLELCHRVGHHDALVHAGRWESCGSFCFWDTPQMELAGKTLGIVGFGRIGQAVANIARAFGMNVLSYSRTRRPEGEALARYVDLDTLLAQSDFVSLHCPLTPATAKLINAGTLAKMKAGAILINTSRGGLVDEAAVKAALESGRLRAAAVDVVSEEPITAGNPLLTAPNCIITPHMAWAPLESRQRLLDCVVENIRCFLEGKPQNVVNL